jgi:hypothetical protein
MFIGKLPTFRSSVFNLLMLRTGYIVVTVSLSLSMSSSYGIIESLAFQISPLDIKENPRLKPSSSSETQPINQRARNYG